MPSSSYRSPDEASSRGAAEAADASVWRAELLELYRQAPLALAFLDPQWRLVRVNQRFADLAGRSVNDQVGRTLQELLPELAAVLPADRRTLTEGWQGLEVTVPSPPSSLAAARCWRVSGHPVRNAAGGVVGLSLMVEDTTEQREHERQRADSEHRWRALFDAEPACVQFLTPDGRFLEMNRAGLKMFEADGPEEIAGRSLVEFAATRDRAALERLMSEAAGGTADTLELEIVGLRGTQRCLELHATPLHDDQGELTAILALMRDMTQRKRIRDALRQSEANLAAAQSLAHLGSWEIDLQDLHDINRNPLYWSDEVFRIFGYEPGGCEVSNETFFYAVHPDDRERVREAATRAFAEGTPYRLEHRIVRPDGTQRSVHEEAHFVYDEETQVPRKMIGIVLDITERKEVELALRESELRYRRLFDHAGMGISFFGTDRRFLAVNDLVAEFFRRSREEIVGQRLDEIAPIQICGPFLEALARSAESGLTINHEDCVTIGGNQRWFSSRLSPVRDAEGLLMGVQVVTHEVSDRKLAELELKASEQRLQLAMSAAEMGSWDWDLRTGRIIWSEGHERLWAKEPGTFRGTYEEFAERLHPEDRNAVEARVIQARDHRVPFVHEFRIVWPNGKVLWLIGKGRFLYDESGEPQRMIGVVMDVTQRKEMELELLRQRAVLDDANIELERRVAKRTAELESKNTELEAFVRSVSHDLRAPLRAIEGFAQALAEDVGPSIQQPQMSYIESIRDAALRMESLISDLLAYSRVGREVLRFRSLNLRDIVENVIQEHRHEIIRSGADVGLVGDWQHVFGNERILREAINNLLSNALKFVAPGTQPVVRFFVESHGRMQRLCVSDNGIGVPAEYHELIFGVFERLHGIETFPGTGIGLAIVSRAAERLGGRCGVQSQPGLGSCFWLEIPQAEALDTSGLR